MHISSGISKPKGRTYGHPFGSATADPSHLDCCHQMSHFKVTKHQIRFWQDSVEELAVPPGVKVRKQWKLSLHFGFYPLYLIVKSLHIKAQLWRVFHFAPHFSIMCLQLISSTLQ